MSVMNPYGTPGTPPFLPQVIVPGDGPPTIPSPGTSPEMSSGGLPPAPVQITYNPFPYCFGLDKIICQYIPVSVRLGSDPNSIYPFGVDVPLAGLCGALVSVFCIAIVVGFLLIILGLAFGNLLR